MLATLIPLFDESMCVSAYSLFSQKENLLANPRFFVSAYLDGAYSIDGLEVINALGMASLPDNVDLFIPVNNVSLFTNISEQCPECHDRIVLLVDKSVRNSRMYINRIEELKKDGYKFAIRKVADAQYEEYKPVFELMDYVLINNKKEDILKAKAYFRKEFPNVKLVCGNLTKDKDFEKAKSEKYDLFEGPFYRMPVTVGENEVAPLKINYIELLNTINKPDFDLTEAADIISRDTALVIALLKIVNRLSRNSEVTTIRHAAAMLGQKELKKWIITAVTEQLCSDKPNEITRISLIRAKFAENLAEYFELKGFSQELFLMGLFSVIDIILDKPMSEALEMIKVSKNTSDALINGKGEFADILSFISAYDSAEWQEVSRVIIVKKLDMDKVYDAYLGALKWYRDLFFEE